MAITTISDVIVPEPMYNYLVDTLVRQNLLFQSGIVVADPIMAGLLTIGGSKFTFPFWGDITQDESEIPVEGAAATPGKIGTKELDAARQMRKADWGAGRLASILAGSDAMSAIQNQVADYWATQFQNILNETIKGVTGSTDGLANILLDKAATDGVDPTAANLTSVEHIIDAICLLGDNAGKFKGIMVDSKVYNDMQKDDLISYVAISGQPQDVPMYREMVVFVDDNLPKYVRTSATLGNQDVYMTILIKGGAFMFAESANGFEPVYVDHDRSKGMGEETLYTKRMFSLHPAGWNWTGTPAGLSATNAELATVTNWAMVTEAKNNLFVGLLTN